MYAGVDFLDFVILRKKSICNFSTLLRFLKPHNSLENFSIGTLVISNNLNCKSIGRLWLLIRLYSRYMTLSACVQISSSFKKSAIWKRYQGIYTYQHSGCPFHLELKYTFLKLRLFDPNTITFVLCWQLIAIFYNKYWSQLDIFGVVPDWWLTVQCHLQITVQEYTAFWLFDHHYIQFQYQYYYVLEDIHLNQL